MPTITDLTPDELRRLYEDELLPESEIARMYGTYQVRVNRLRKTYGIPTIGKTGRQTAMLPALTDHQAQLIIGSLLGDGFMYAPSESTACFCESHGEAQELYLRWKGDQLGPHASSYTRTVKRLPDGREFHGWRLNGAASTRVRGLYDLFYPLPSRKKQFPENLPELMTPLVLTVWYLDDGSLANGAKPRIAMGLNQRSLRRALSALRTLGLRPRAAWGKGAWNITFPGQSERFFDLVRDHVPSCMSYKLPVLTARREADARARALTEPRARALLRSGKSVREVARSYGVGESTVRRRTRGEAPASCSLSAADAAELLRDAHLSSDADVDEVVRILRRAPFPYPAHLEDQEFDAEVERLRGTVMRIEDRTILPWAVTGVRACSPYFPNRFTARSGSGASPIEAWYDDEVLRWAVKFQLGQGDPVTPHRVLRAVTMRCRAPSVFRPSVAAWIYRTYARPGATVWDPCAGYGGRLLGAHVAGVRYVGCDVDEATVSGVRALGERLGADARVVQASAEEFDPGAVGLVFTSPPYFDRERYSEAGAQSWRRYGSDVESWVGGFLCPVLTTAARSLPPGGPLVLNVADVRSGSGRRPVPLIELTERVAGECGFSLLERLWMPLARLNRTPEAAREPVLVFSRATA